MTDVTIVIPTIGRESLADLMRALAPQIGSWPVVVVDDRSTPGHPLVVAGATVLHSGGRGPAAARNRGWRAADTEWVVFLDDDVVPEPDWAQGLERDLAGADRWVVGVQGRVHVPLPTHRRATDWERNTAGLATARWITASMAYRRTALESVAGFDERFPRAYREDSDLALRLVARGGVLVQGSHGVVHPVRSAGFWASVTAQRGNSDDMLMRRRHGAGWRTAAGAPRGRRNRHVLTTALALLAGAAASRGNRRSAAAVGLAWGVATTRFAAARIAPGPRDPAEVLRMIATSIAIPPVATWYSLHGVIRHAKAGPWGQTSTAADLVLFDRDGTLVIDVPYNRDPGRVVPMPGARRALRRLREHGVRVGVVTNQSGVGRGLIEPAEMAAVNARIETLLGPFDIWQVCPHTPADGCDCRKPEPAMVQRACAALGIPVERTVVVGDIGADVAAAGAAGADSILVPTPVTRDDEVAQAPVAAHDLEAAVDLILGVRS